MCFNFTGKNKEKSIKKNALGQEITMTEYQEKIKGTNKFRRSVEELKEFIKENDIKLSELLKYIRKRKVKNEN